MLVFNVEHSMHSMFSLPQLVEIRHTLCQIHVLPPNSGQIVMLSGQIVKRLFRILLSVLKNLYWWIFLTLRCPHWHVFMSYLILESSVLVTESQRVKFAIHSSCKKDIKGSICHTRY